MWVGDDLDAKDVRQTGTAVTSESAEDEILAFLIEDQDPRQHGGDGGELIPEV